MSKKTILLCAGGTGGHLFPAQALGDELRNRGWNIHLATDTRAAKFATNFSDDTIHILASDTIRRRNPISLFLTLLRLAQGYLQSHRLLRRYKVDVVIGFGGYPTLPPLLAACHARLPTIIHEQNAKMGRANRFLSTKVAKVAGGFELPDISNFVLTGNPLRQDVHDAAKLPYPIRDKNDKFKFLVFGGSQSSQFISQFALKTISQLPHDYASRLELTLQAKNISDMNINAEISEFFDDMPHRIANSHLILCRSGAGSVCELSLIGRPSILVPLPDSLDDDQGANASHLVDADAAIMVRQSDLTIEYLSQLLMEAMDNPDTLLHQSANAKKLSISDSTYTLSNLIESLVERKNA